MLQGLPGSGNVGAGMWECKRVRWELPPRFNLHTRAQLPWSIPTGENPLTLARCSPVSWCLALWSSAGAELSGAQLRRSTPAPRLAPRLAPGPAPRHKGSAYGIAGVPGEGSARPRGGEAPPPARGWLPIHEPLSQNTLENFHKNFHTKPWLSKHLKQTFEAFLKHS